MNELIKQYLDEHIKKEGLPLTEEQYQQAYNGIAYWLTTTLPEAVSDSISGLNLKTPTILSVTYVSVWDGFEIRTKAKYDTVLKNVFDIERVEGENIQSFDLEYIELPNGKKLPVYEKNGIYTTESSQR